MEIVFVASEMVPFAKTGGLGDVLGSLPLGIAKAGHQVSVFLPRYKKIEIRKFKLERVLTGLEIPIGTETEAASVYSTTVHGVPVFFLDQPDYFDRDELYGTPNGDYPDNDRRYTYFQRAVLEALKRLRIKPDVLHANDWQAGLLPVYLKTVYRDDPFFKKTKTFFTIHNLSYQGNFPPDSMALTGLAFGEFRYERLEFYGKVSFIKGGIVYADVVTTVSHQYAEEIQTKAYGCGLEGTLSYRKDDLYGIVNGIHPSDWDPQHDTEIEANFSARDLMGKKVCKEALQQRSRLRLHSDAPLLGFVGRLVSQKGVDLLIELIEQMAKMKWQLVVLGTGEEKYHKVLRIFAKRHPDLIGVRITFDEQFAKQIYAGADLFLMPSQFEPCGLGQMIALRYGTIPVVRETGGLADTIAEFDPKSGKGNGFVFSEYNADSFMKAMRRAVSVYQDDQTWAKLVGNAMSSDFSWRASARRYIKLYEGAERKPVKV